jgi:DNA-binding XRE family transcriptional regulator
MNYIDPMTETVKDFGRITGIMEILAKRGYTPTQALKEIGRVIKENEMRSLEDRRPDGIILEGGSYRCAPGDITEAVNDANQVFEFRVNSGMTQKEMAHLLGVTKNYVYLVESGKKPMTSAILKKLESLTKVTEVQP